MSSRSYQQHCPLARALDVVGDRWALLIVRELIPGARRFTDLLEGLPGISRNLLTQRLRDLERDGVVTKEDLPAPAARTVYALTGDGRELADALVPLIRWGAGRLGDREPHTAFLPRSSAVAMASLADRDAARGVDETYQYLVGDSAFFFTVADGAIRVHDGTTAEPAVVVTTDEGTYVKIASGRASASEAAAQGALTFEGSAEAMNRLRTIFSRRRGRTPQLQTRT